MGGYSTAVVAETVGSTAVAAEAVGAVVRARRNWKVKEGHGFHLKECELFCGNAPWVVFLLRIMLLYIVAPTVERITSNRKASLYQPLSYRLGWRSHHQQ